MDSDVTGPCTRLYAVGCTWASVVVPYRRHTYLESESPRVGWLDARVTLGSRQERNGRVGFGISILGRWPLIFSLEWWGLYTIRGVWPPSCLPLEGVNHIHSHGVLGYFTTTRVMRMMTPFLCGRTLSTGMEMHGPDR
jgi:hypothetical protein